MGVGAGWASVLRAAFGASAEGRTVCVLLGRVVEDYAVIFFGSAVFKISRLLLIAMMCAAPACSSVARRCFWGVWGPMCARRPRRKAQSARFGLGLCVYIRASV